MDGNNCCNRSNRVGELNRLSKLDDRYVVVLSRIICSENLIILLCVNIKHLHSFMGLINHNLVVAVVVWMRCPGSNTDLRLQLVIFDGL